MGTFVLSHFSALWWFLSHRDPHVDSNAPYLAIPTSADAPDALLVEQLRWTIGIEGPLDFLVLGNGAFRRSTAVRPHSCTQDLPPGSLIPIACHASDAELFVCSPELAFLQICQIVDTCEAIYFGMCACSEFRFDPLVQGGVVYRAEGSHSIASVRSMEAFLDSAKGVRGIKRARMALAHVREHARSPKECALGMLLCLPSRLGGFDLGQLSFNERVRVYDGHDRWGRSKYITRYPDIAIRSKIREDERRMVFVDYDPVSTHAGEGKALLDSRRRNDIATIRDVPHFSITSDDAASFEYLEMLADRIRRWLGRRARPLLRGSKDSPHNREILCRAREQRHLLWSQLVVKSFDAVISEMI